MMSTEYQKKWFRNKYTNDLLFKANLTANKEFRRQRNLKITYGIKNRPCMDCQGYFNPWQMQFDHKPGTIKKYDIGSMCSRASSVKNLLSEIAKCDIVCSNCHWNRTYKRLQDKKCLK